MAEKIEKQVKARNERRRFKVDYTTINELEKMPFVIRVDENPKSRCGYGRREVLNIQYAQGSAR